MNTFNHTARYMHWFLPLPFIIIASWLLDYQGFDLTITDMIYSDQDNQWQLKKHWFFEDVIHKGGRKLAALMLVTCLLALILSYYHSSLHRYRRGLIYLNSTVIISLLVIALLKATTHIACPWDFQRYGGDQIFMPIYKSLFRGSGGNCFPAGHSSAGYSWIAVYFFCRYYGSRWQWPTLCAAIVMGMSFGVSQQIRGAHFLSHDLWTLNLCWYISLAGYYILVGKNQSENSSLDYRQQ